MKTSLGVLLLVAAAAALFTFSCGPVRGDCSPASCTGCCDEAGECQLGTAAVACGTAGALCTECSAAQFCSLGGCVNIQTTRSDGGPGGQDGGKVDGGGATDGGITDGGTTDGGTTDGGLFDGGTKLDGGLTDGGTGCRSTGASCAGSSACCSGSCVANLCAPSPGDACSNAQPLTFSQSGSSMLATASGSTVGYANDRATTSCTATGPDRVYAFTLGASTDLSVTLIGTGGLAPVAQLAGPCTSEPLTCASGALNGSASFSHTVPAGTWFLWVDGANGSAGSYSLTVTAQPACSGGLVNCNGTCRDLQSDVEHCGTCNLSCPPPPANSTASCSAGTCGSTCLAGFYDCNGSSLDGCESPAPCSGTVRYGNTTYLGTDSSHSPNYLLGTQLSVPTSGTLTHFGVVGRSAGPLFQMALYRDNGGVPGSLVASTGITTLSATTLEVPVSPVSLSAGSYWIMAIFDRTASVGKDESTSIMIRYISHTFGSPLPQTFPATHQSYTGQHFNYYIVMN